MQPVRPGADRDRGAAPVSDKALIIVALWLVASFFAGIAVGKAFRYGRTGSTKYRPDIDEDYCDGC